MLGVGGMAAASASPLPSLLDPPATALRLSQSPPTPRHCCCCCRCEPGAAPLRVALLLSGGVDSSLAAHLLKAAGHDVTAFYLQICFQVGWVD